MKLDIQSAIFTFLANDELCYVTYINTGRGEINGHSYARIYSVKIEMYGYCIGDTRTSGDANLSNAKRLALAAISLL